MFVAAFILFYFTCATEDKHTHNMICYIIADIINTSSTCNINNIHTTPTPTSVLMA